MIRRWWSVHIFPPRSEQHVLRLPHAPRWLIVGMLWLLLTIGLWAALILPAVGLYSALEIGRASPVTIQSPHNAEFVSNVLTEQERSKAQERLENNVFAINFSVPNQQRLALNSLLTAVTTIRDDSTLSEPEKVQAIMKLAEISDQFANVELTEARVQEMVSLRDTAWDSVYDQTLHLYDQAIERYELELDEKTIQRLTDRWLPTWTSGMPEPEGTLMRFLVSSFLAVNTTLDVEATEQRKQEARENVEPVVVKIQAGQTIVRVGDIVRPETIEILGQLGALPQPLGWVMIGGRGLLSALLASVFLLHFYFFQRETVWHARRLLVIILTVLVTALAARVLMNLWPDYPYAFPLAIVALVLTVVFNAPVALVSSILLSVVLGIINGESLALTVTFLLGSVVAIFAVRNAERSVTFLLAGGFIAAVTILTQVAFWMTDQGSLLIQGESLMYIMLYGLGNGVLAAILSLGLFNLVGHAAGVVTPMQLMELAHPSQPLLRKLTREAPGTYYHSVAVGNLSEAAAEAIGADALLLRVGAYYHDIGKTIRPFFFTDNQTGRENVHNDLDPRTSAQIIVDHVREGVKMAQATGLPQPIIDFISTHHGTHVIQHFYQLALQQEDTVELSDFRYPGPIPWTREQGILMLADSVEATVRSKAQNGRLVPRSLLESGQAPTGSQTLEDTVNGIIDNRVQSGQLDHTPLTLHEIVLIREAFIASLRGIYHPRVDYAPPLVKQAI